MPAIGRTARAELNPEAAPTTDMHIMTSAHPPIASFDACVRTVICFNKIRYADAGSATLTSNPKLGP